MKNINPTYYFILVLILIIGTFLFLVAHGSPKRGFPTINKEVPSENGTNSIAVRPADFKSYEETCGEAGGIPYWVKTWDKGSAPRGQYSSSTLYVFEDIYRHFCTNPEVKPGNMITIDYQKVLSKKEEEKMNHDICPKGGCETYTAYSREYCARHTELSCHNK